MTPDKILVLDFETTGLSEDNRPVEVAWIEIDQNFQKIKEVSHLVNPQIPIEPSATEVHGISDEQVAECPTLEEVLKAEGITEQMKILLVAHNAVFDAKYLRPFVSELEFVCTKRIAWTVNPDAPNAKLSTLVEYLGLKANPTHRALADVEGCLEYLKYVNGLGLNLSEMKRASDEAIENMEMPFGKHKGVLVANLPRSYVSWMRENMNIDGDLKEALDLNFR